jgi:hypothetical protein
VQFTGSGGVVGAAVGDAVGGAVGDAVGVGSGVGDGLGVGVGVGIEIGVGFGVAVAGSITTTDWTVDEVTALPSPIVSVTAYVPGAPKSCTGPAVVSAGDPSPKSHDHVVGDPVDESWNVTP